MTLSGDIPVNELISRIKVMYLAVYANGSFNDDLKAILNEEFEALGLEGDARFISRKLAQRQRAELDRDFHNALDEIFYTVSMFSERAHVAHRLLVLFMKMVESDGIITQSEEVLARELAECLDLDIDYYLDRTE